MKGGDTMKYFEAPKATVLGFDVDDILTTSSPASSTADECTSYSCPNEGEDDCFVL